MTQAEPGLLTPEPGLPVDPALIVQYTQGDCHIFAIACHLEHGGNFLVAFDTNEVHWFDSEGKPEHYKVLHVYARMHGPEGIVIRDICGDRPEDSEAIRSELSEQFVVWAEDVILEEMTPDELHRLISDEIGSIAEDLQVLEPLPGLDNDDRPLWGYTPAMLADARQLPEVLAEPGTRSAPARREAVAEDPGFA